MSFKRRVEEILNILIFSKKIYSKPKKNDILIFDSDLSDLILHYLDTSKVHVLDNRYKQHKGQKINIFILIKMLFNLKFSSYEYFKMLLNVHMSLVLLSTSYMLFLFLTKMTDRGLPLRVTDVTPRCRRGC